MTKLPSKYKNRYWCKEEYTYILYFKLFEEEVLKFETPISGNEYYYTSELLNVKIDYIEADSPEKAMMEFEQMLSDYFVEQWNYYQEALESFEELE